MACFVSPFSITVNCIQPQRKMVWKDCDHSLYSAIASSSRSMLLKPQGWWHRRLPPSFLRAFDTASQHVVNRPLCELPRLISKLCWHSLVVTSSSYAVMTRLTFLSGGWWINREFYISWSAWGLDATCSSASFQIFWSSLAACRGSWLNTSWSNSPFIVSVGSACVSAR